MPASVRAATATSASPDDRSIRLNPRIRTPRITRWRPEVALFVAPTLPRGRGRVQGFSPGSGGAPPQSESGEAEQDQNAAQQKPDRRVCPATPSPPPRGGGGSTRPGRGRGRRPDGPPR